jgi:hypothetical protein
MDLFRIAVTCNQVCSETRAAIASIPGKMEY